MFQLMSVRFARHSSSACWINTAKNAPLMRQIAPAIVGEASCCSVSLQRLRPTSTRSFAAAAAAEAEAEQGRGITVARSKGKGSGYCYGCGADLVKGTTGSMATAPKKTGYWAEKNQTLKISKLKNWSLCPRCKKLNKIANDSDALEKIIDDLGPDSAMTEVFRKEVGKLRAKQNIVVVLCVDAVNVAGTLIRTIRNYVGGNPILLAVTRCDLLPNYVWDAKSVPEVKEVFAQRASEIQPADIYLCSEEKEFMKRIPGIKELAKDIWKNLNKRDIYVVGAANIGKSTLTDALIRRFIRRGERELHFGDRLSKKRLEKLREARVTKSALPGTTLQNIRVPCFEDHTQALWDTPGLLLDVSLSHFPIQDFKRIRASRPSTIEPSILEVPEMSFALLICEKGDKKPLLRVEVRLNKNAEGEGPVRLVWNSTLPLDTKVVDIESAREDEKERAMQLEKTQLRQTPRLEPELMSKERAASKEERRRLYEERIKKEQEELGMKEWNAQQAEKRAKGLEFRRAKMLAKLSKVDQVIIDGGVGMDLEIANFGWIGILPPRMAMVKTFAPSTGVRVAKTSPMALPVDWGEYKTPKAKKEKERKQSQKENRDDVESGDESEMGDHEDYDLWGEEIELDDDEDYNLGLYGWDDEIVDEHAFTRNRSHYGRYDDFEGNRRYPFDRNDETKDDPWEKYSGEHVGWQFDADTRWSKGEKFEGWNPIRKE